ncbi:MAG: hypothetical protein A2297_05065 [Elusimicrobia bacterium RIFOXYB2_FULL_48_7]|nr:MAG: hypothetical protein A2297_05065 [Elusimicrobia bacterium RIFOXYB2_FULL_48_7]
MENKFQCAIFDLDGVIVNTVPLHFRAWKKLFEEYGKKFDFQDYLEKVDGIPRIAGTKAILTDLQEDKIVIASDKKQKYFMKFLRELEIPVFNSTVKLIKNLKSRKLKLAVVSSSKNCSYIIKKAGLNKLFDTAFTGNDIIKGKPDPQIFLTTAERLKVKPGNCVVFEDAILGVEAAKRAKMKCVGIDRLGKPERLKKADLIVKDLKELNFNTLQSLF